MLVLGQNSNSLSQKHQGCNAISKEQPSSSITYHEQAFLNNLQLLSKHFHSKMELTKYVDPHGNKHSTLVCLKGMCFTEIQSNGNDLL